VKHTASDPFGIEAVIFLSWEDDRMKDFETEHRIWLNKHMDQSSGERLRRLKKCHGFGEKSLLQHAWWPVIGSLDNLYPEYEFIDPDGNYYYMDFAYIRHPKPTCLESDSFSSHARDADRETFSRGLDRQNEIFFADWNILRFSIDKLKENPVACQRTVKRMLELWYGADSENIKKLPLYKREIVRLASSSTRPITPAMVGDCLGRKETFVLHLLHEMVEEGLLEPVTGDARIRSYRLKK
jgi:hypothetical protein